MSPVTINLKRTVRDPYPRTAGCDTDVGAFSDSTTVMSTTGSMTRLVLKDNITTGEELAPGQTVTPSMRLYLPRVEARLRGIIALKAYVASEVIFTQPM